MDSNTTVGGPSSACHHSSGASYRANNSFYFILSSEINAYQKQIKVISITSEMI